MPGRGEALPPANVGVGYALSPEGQRVIYVAAALDGALQLWERRLDDVAPEPIPGTEDADTRFFRPMGSLSLSGRPRASRRSRYWADPRSR